MYIRTTYSMRLEVVEKLEKAETKTGKSREELIMLCARRMLKDYKHYMRDMQRIEYQKRFDEITGLPIPKVRVKVKFFIREYNFFQDMRKFFSRSISLSIAIAVFTYLEEIVASLLRDGEDIEEYNYPYNSYAYAEKCIENITTFRIWWGLPDNLEKVLHE